MCCRYNQINDSVTHVIVDSLTEDIVTQLKAVSSTRYATAAACFLHRLLLLNLSSRGTGSYPTLKPPYYFGRVCINFYFVIKHNFLMAVLTHIFNDRLVDVNWSLCVLYNVDDCEQPLRIFAARRGALVRHLLWRRGCLSVCVCLSACLPH